MSFVLRLDVPLAKSSASRSKVENPRDAASTAVPTAVERAASSAAAPKPQAAAPAAASALPATNAASSASVPADWIVSAHGEIELPARVSDEVVRGTLAVPHGWGHRGGWRRAR